MRVPAFLITCVLSGGCRRPPAPPQAGANEPAPTATDRIDVPAPVRQNLGITFAKVETRRVATTLRMPGRFELLPHARREYRTAMAGRVEFLVSHLDPVAAGQPLYRLDAPAWLATQRELADLESNLAIAAARIDAMAELFVAHKAHEDSLNEAIRVWTERARTLEELQGTTGGRAAELAEARAQIATLRATYAEAEEKHANLSVQQLELRSNQRALQAQLERALHGAAALVGVPAASLSASRPGSGPAWRSWTGLTVQSLCAGKVETLAMAHGAWVEPGQLVLATVDLGMLQFHASALQSDLALLRDGAPARVVPPMGGKWGVEATADCTLKLGVAADPEHRTLEVFAVPGRLPAWARPGVTGFLEIETAAGGAGELALPSACVMTDGLQRVFFRRDPQNPDKVIRVVADLGVDDGRWVEVLSGIKAGDEVVVHGAYELLLATTGSANKGGHFHSDGTFHAEGK